MADLKPCPFCGGDADLVCAGPGNWYARCRVCVAATDDGSKERAVERWNKRTEPPTIRDLRERSVRARKDEAEACAKMLVQHVELYRNMGSRFQDHEFPLLNAAGSIRMREHEQYRAPLDAKNPPPAD